MQSSALVEYVLMPGHVVVFSRPHEHISMESEGAHTTMHFTLQVQNRIHLAHIMCSLRRIPEVNRINRVKA